MNWFADPADMPGSHRYCGAVCSHAILCWAAQCIDDSVGEGQEGADLWLIFVAAPQVLRELHWEVLMPFQRHCAVRAV